MSYNGPTEIGYFTVPGRGISYHMEIGGHNVQIYLTEKRKKIRVWVDYEEWKK